MKKKDVSMNGLPGLLDIGTCGIHTIYGSLKHAEKESEWDVGKVPFLLDPPARRETFE